MPNRTVHYKVCDFCGAEVRFDNGLPNKVAEWGEFTHYDDDRNDSSGNLSRVMDTCPDCTADILTLKKVGGTE